MSKKDYKKKELNEEERLRYERWLHYSKSSEERAAAAAARRNTALITI